MSHDVITAYTTGWIFWLSGGICEETSLIHIWDFYRDIPPSTLSIQSVAYGYVRWPGSLCDDAPYVVNENPVTLQFAVMIAANWHVFEELFECFQQHLFLVRMV